MKDKLRKFTIRYNNYKTKKAQEIDLNRIE